jgi:hypothetical protein
VTLNFNDAERAVVLRAEERLRDGSDAFGVGGQLEACSWLGGMSRCMIRALTSGIIGSSSGWGGTVIGEEPSARTHEIRDILGQPVTG